MGDHVARLAVVLALASAQSVGSTAVLSFTAPVRGLEPNSFTINWGAGLALAANDRVQVHLPGFAGGYNSFATTGPASGLGIASPFANGLKGWVSAGNYIDAFTSAEWDERGEVLRLVVTAAQAAGNVQGLYIDSAEIRHGLGPLPPSGGIDAKWYKSAHVRKFSSGDCTGGSSTRPGFGDEVCDTSVITGGATDTILFDASSEQFTSANSWLPTKRGLGAVGTFAAPQIVFSSAGFSSTGVDALNCITVTLISSMTITSPASDLITELTLSGLRAFSQPTSQEFPLFVNRALCLAGTSATTTLPGGFASTAKWDKEKGEVVATIAGGNYLVAGQVVDFTMRIRNGGQPSTTPSLTLSVTDGFYCKGAGLCDAGARFSTSASVPTESPASLRRQRTFETTGPSFDTRKVHQSTNDPGQSATITLTITPNAALASGGKITVSGLCGTIANAATFTLTGPATAESWDSTELKLVTTSALVADTEYVISWSWFLLNTGNSACSVAISASGTNTFPAQTMENVGGSAGLVDPPKFIVHNIGQYTTRPDATNYICVTLETNFDFKTGSKLVMRGFAASSSGTQEAMPLYQCPAADIGSTAPGLITNGVLLSASKDTADTFDFSAEYPGAASMVVSATNFILRRTPFVFALSLKNPPAASTCQDISLEATGDITQAVTLQASTVDRAFVDGMENGDRCVFRTYDPGFLVGSIAQESFSAGQQNTLTVSITSNILLSSSGSGYSSKLTLAGLRGTKTLSSPSSQDAADSLTYLAITSVPTNFMPRFSHADWTSDTGTLVLTIAPGTCVNPTTAGQSTLCIVPGFLYAFTFTLMNGDKGQKAAQVMLTASYASAGDAKATNQRRLDPPTSEELAPLYIIPANQLLYKYNIGQTWPAPAARNAICVTLGLSQAVDANVGGAGRFTSFTISGLTGYKMDNQNLPLLQSSDGRTPLAAAQAAHDIFGAEIDDAGRRNFAAFDSTAGTATLFVVGSALARTDYDFCFHVTNPDSETDCASKDVQIATRWKNEVLSLQMLQDKSTLITDYPTGSACVGYTAKRSFTRARLRGHSNVTGAVSSMICELVTNYPLKAQDTFTISGLMGFSRQFSNDETSVSVLVSANGLLKKTFLQAADFKSNQLVFRLSEPMLAEDSLLDATLVEQVYVMAFDLKNGESEQEAPILYIEASNGIGRQIMETGRPEDVNVSNSLGDLGEAGAPQAASSATPGCTAGCLIAIIAGVLGGGAVLAAGGYYLKTKGSPLTAVPTSQVPMNGAESKGGSLNKPLKPGASEATLKPPVVEASTIAPISMLPGHMGMPPPHMSMPPFGMPFR